MAVKPKELRYAVEVDRTGRAATEGAAGLEPPPGWSPEHLVLAGLVRCTLESLRFYARRAGAEATGSGSARGVVTRRERDGRYAFVEIEVALDVRVEPAPERPEQLVAQAERGCFVGASLTAAPGYRWTVNGAAVTTAPAAPS